MGGFLLGGAWGLKTDQGGVGFQSFVCMYRYACIEGKHGYLLLDFDLVRYLLHVGAGLCLCV